MSQKHVKFLKKYPRRIKKSALLRLPMENKLLFFSFCSTWQEILTPVLLHKFLKMGQTLQIVRHRQNSPLEVDTVERKKIALNSM